MQCAVDVSPPEIVFPRVALGISDPDWDMRSDIWSLACTVSLTNSIQLLINPILWIDLRDGFWVEPFPRREPCSKRRFLGPDGGDGRTAAADVGLI